MRRRQDGFIFIHSSEPCSWGFITWAHKQQQIYKYRTLEKLFVLFLNPTWRSLGFWPWPLTTNTHTYIPIHTHTHLLCTLPVHKRSHLLIWMWKCCLSAAIHHSSQRGCCGNRKMKYVCVCALNSKHTPSMHFTVRCCCRYSAPTAIQDYF